VQANQQHPAAAHQHYAASITHMTSLSTSECSPALQIAKLLIIPFVCMVELLYMRKRFSAPVVASIAVVIIGVAIV
jgi:hypothetical protein